MTAPATTCKHHWIIAEPGGPVSDGRCKLCGRARDFINSEEGLIEAATKRGKGPKGTGLTINPHRKKVGVMSSIRG